MPAKWNFFSILTVQYINEEIAYLLPTIYEDPQIGKKLCVVIKLCILYMLASEKKSILFWKQISLDMILHTLIEVFILLKKVM